MEVPRFWRTQRTRYCLIGVVCEACGAKAFPPRGACPRCKASSLREHSFSGRGSVYSYSMVYQAPEGFGGLVPYAAALVKLEEGPLVATQLTDVDADALNVGMPVEMVTRRLSEDGPDGIVVYGYKFRPCVPRGPVA